MMAALLVSNSVPFTTMLPKADMVPLLIIPLPPIPPPAVIPPPPLPQEISRKTENRDIGSGE
jgi:hypothetical protein